MSKDYYAVLGLPRSATGNQVRSRFLELARAKHPDRFSGESKERSEEEFQEITEAANVLSDPALRREYDSQAGGPSVDQPEATRLGEVYLKMGVESYKKGDFEKAAENFHRATKEDPSSAKAWYSFAKACNRQQKFKAKALSAIDRACRLEPMNSSYLELAGDLARDSGQLTRAEGYYRKALAWGGEAARIEGELEAIRKGGSKAKGGFFGKAT